MTISDIQPDDSGAVAVPTPISKVRRALSTLKRELTDEELASTGTQKMILEELERLSEENCDLASYKDRFHQVDKVVAVFQEKHKRHISTEIISGCCLSVGSASLGYAPSLWANQPSGYILLAFGVLLTIGGVVSKAVKL